MANSDTTQQLPWYDQPNATRILQEKAESGSVDANDSRLLEDFISKGFVILPGAVDEETIDLINRDFDNAGNNRERILLRKGGKYKHPGPLGVVGRRMRVIDFYVPCHAALKAMLAPTVCRLMHHLYDEPPLAFQSLLFHVGSQQDVHQDPAYVNIDQPSLLLASWIALEDIQPGSGELCYYPGSHRNIHYLFDEGKTMWNREQDSQESNKSYAASLEQLCEQSGLEKETFLPKKGDVLIWHANLVHGGMPIIDENLTRRSLVAHYCPASTAPYYFHTGDHCIKRKYGEGLYASRHYDLRPESSNPFPVFTGGVDIAGEQGLSYK